MWDCFIPLIWSLFYGGSQFNFGRSDPNSAFPSNHLVIMRNFFLSHLFALFLWDVPNLILGKVILILPFHPTTLCWYGIFLSHLFGLFFMGGSQFNFGRSDPNSALLVEKGPGLAFIPPEVQEPLPRCWITAGTSGHFGIDEKYCEYFGRPWWKKHCPTWEMAQAAGECFIFVTSSIQLQLLEQNLPLPQPLSLLLWALPGWEMIPCSALPLLFLNPTAPLWSISAQATSTCCSCLKVIIPP